MNQHILIVANWDWVIFNFRLPLARKLEEAGYQVTFASPSGQYVSQIQELGFRWVPWKMVRRSTNPFGELLAILDLFRLYRRLRPSAVHHFTIKPILYGSLAAKLAGVPLIINNFTGLGYLFSESKNAALMRFGVTPVLKVMLRGRRLHTVFQTEGDRNALIKRGIVDRDATTIVPGTGVDVERFYPREKVNSRNGPPIVFMAARLLWDKGVAEFVKAAEKINRQEVLAHFRIAGDADPGNPACIPSEVLNDWSTSGIVSFLGHRSDISELLRQADIAVLPSYHEGVPLFLLEAAASGLPLVATDIEGCRAVIKGGENGYLVALKDVEGLEHALKQLIFDENLRISMGRASRQIVELGFSQSIILEKYLALYQTLLKSI